MPEVSYKGARERVGLSTGMMRGALPSRPAHRHDNRILMGLPPDELAALAQHLHVVALPTGALLRHQDAALDHVYFPHQGVISLLATTSSGQTIEVASAGRGSALYPILASEPRDGLLAVLAPGPLRASRIAAARLQAVATPGSVLAGAIAICREALLLQQRQNLICSGLHSVEHRLARWLLETADRLESDLVSATQEQVAQRLGVRRTTVTLLASKLQEVGAIRWGRSRVQLTDRARLETMACGCCAALRQRLPATLPAAAEFAS